jgi:hypothetical protein
MDCVKDDMKIKGVSMKMSDRREWKKKMGACGGYLFISIIFSSESIQHFICVQIAKRTFSNSLDYYAFVSFY